MASQLSLYNAALRMLGERKLASLTENREPRRLLDDAWDDEARRYCLEQGLWKHALRSVSISADPDATPSFGYANSFDKPADWVRTAALCSDEYFNAPLTQYTDEGGRFYSDVDPIYLRYVSDGADFGLDYSKWPETFTQWVAAYLAVQICPRLTDSDTKLQIVLKRARTLLVDARSKDAMNGATEFPPPGSWVSARTGGTRRDRGSRSRLIG